jgi:RNA polymerase sigma factor (sigma-70 family)
VAVATDADLVAAVAAGDSGAFGELYRRHFPTVLRVCERRVPAAADDIAQAAFLRALDNIEQCRGDRRFGGWVQTIALRLCTDHHRANARIADGDWDFDRFHANEAESLPERAVLAAEQRHHLVAALSALPERQRDVLRSRDLDERRPSEIAAAFGLSVGAVDSVLMRARRRAAETYRALSADTGAASIGTTAGTAVTSASALGHGHVLGAVSRLAQAVAGAARDLAARALTSPLGHVVSSPRPAAGLAAVAVAVGALANGPNAAPDESRPPVKVPPVEVVVPVPAPDFDLPNTPAAPVPVPPAAAVPPAPATPDLPEEPPAAPDGPTVTTAADAVVHLQAQLDGLVSDIVEDPELNLGDFLK